MTRMLQGQHDSFFLRWAWDLGIIVLDNSTTSRDELATIGGDHSDLPWGFSDLLIAWETSST